jgi:MFS family permease
MSYSQEKLMDRNFFKRRWLAITVFFCFLFFQQFDLLIVESIRYKVAELFNAAIQFPEFVSILLVLIIASNFLFWGINFDRHSRRNLLVLAGAMWWASSWLNSLAPTIETFGVSYMVGLLDFGSITGIYSIVGDLFSPRNRGKIFGMLQSAQPIAYFLVFLYFRNILDRVNWRYYFLVSGVIALTLTLIIYLFVREPKRGLREPALIGIRLSGQYLFDWETARDIAKKPSFLLLCGMSLVSVFPWMGFSIWTSSLPLMDPGQINSMAYPIFFPTIVALILGNALGGFLGDTFFFKKKRGRVITILSVYFLSLVTCLPAFLIGDLDNLTVRILVSLTALFIGMGRPNIFAILYDIALPEIRATATGFLFMSQLLGIGLGWLVMKVMAQAFDIWVILFSLTFTSIIVNLLLSAGLLKRVPIEIENLRRHMAYRSQLEARLESQNK